MTTYSWIGGSADWQTATNWSGGIIPGVSATAAFANAGSNTVTISGAENIGIAGVTLSNGNTLLVDGALTPTAGLAVSAATVIVGGTGKISSGSIAVAGGTATLTNSGTIAASNTVAVYFYTAMVSNALGGLISGSTGGVLANAGTIANAGTVSASGTASFGIKLNGSGSIDNSGEVTAGWYGLVLEGTSSVTNSGTVTSGRRGLQAQASVSLDNTGMMSGSQQGILLFAGGTVANSGQIIGSDGLGITGAAAGVVANAGTIYGTYGAAVAMRAGGTISNSATGLIKSGGTYQGVVLDGGTSANVVNAGTITGDTGVQFFNSGTYSAAATLTDSGTILGTGGTAIAFGTANDTLIISGTAAMIQGTVDGGGGTNTLEFASGATAGTLTGSGVLFTNFSNGTVDSGADWTLTGTDTFGSNVSITNSGVMIDAGTLVNAGHFRAATLALSIASGGTLSNAAAGVIAATGSAITASSGSISVSNLGTLLGVTANAIAMVSGQVINGAADDTTALISGLAYGVTASGAATVTNYGSILGGTVGARGGLHLTGGGSVDNAGYIHGRYGVVITGAAGTATNTGLIDATFYAIRLVKGGSVSNAGTLTDPGGVGIGADASATVVDTGVIGTVGTGIQLKAGGSVSIGASGQINAASQAVVIATNGGTIVNSGTMRAGLYGVDGQASVSVANHGLITAGTGISLYAGGMVTNDGTISGQYGIKALFGLTVVNSGTISASGGGAIFYQLGAGGRFGSVTIAVTNAASGLIEDSSGSHNAVYSGNCAIVTNAGTISGAARGILLQAASTVFNSGTIVGNGGTAVAFAAAGDLLQFQPGQAYIKGEVTAAGSGNTLEFASGISAGTLTGVGADFVGFGNGTVDAGARWVLAGSNTLGSNTTLVDAGTLTNTGTLVVDPPITVTGTFINSSIVSAPGTYTAFYLANGGVLTNTGSGSITAGGDAITAAGTVSVTNLGVISSTSLTGVALAAGSVINGAIGNTTALISGTVYGIVASGAATVTNYGSIMGPGNVANTGGVLLTAGGSLNNAGYIAGRVGVLITGGAGTVANTGSIRGEGVAGISLAAGGSVSNAGAISAGSGHGIVATGNATVSDTGLISAGSDGIRMGSGGSVSIGAAGYIYGRQAGIFLNGSTGTVSNSGRIATKYNYGIGLLSGGSITNTGTIAVVPGANAVAIRVTGGAGTISNYGVIEGSSGSGILLNAGGTIIDGGTIGGGYHSSGYAIYFRAGGLLLLTHGYSLSGAVKGASGQNNTLELFGTSATAAVTATYNSLALTSFGTIGFVSGDANYATLKITSDATLPGTITNFTGVHDTIDLTALAFVSGSSSAAFNTTTNQLTIGNGTSAATLQLGSGSYGNLRFHVANDGSGGTDITVAPAPSYAWTASSGDWQTAADWSGGVIPGVSATATITNAGSNTVTVSSGASVQVTGLTLSNNNTLLVAGTFDPTASLSATGATVSIASTGLLTGFGSDTVSNGTMLNAGTLNSAVTLNSGQFTNQSGGRVVNAYIYGVSAGSANTVANFGSISASSGYAVYFRGAGNVSNAAGALIKGPTGIRLNGTNASVANLGSIDAYQAGPHSYAVYLRNGGVVSNGQAGDATAAITGYYGIGIHAAATTAATGTVINAGSIIATGTTAAAIYLANGGIVTNGASTITGAQVTGGGKGAYLSKGTVTNYGTISAGSSGGDVGVVITNGGVLRNLGTAALIQGYDGAQFTTNGTVINGGTIASTRGTSGNALVFAGGNSRLIVDPGAVFIGNVQGVVLSGSATLELASGASQGTFSGLGTQFTAFNTATVDAGASWAFSGSNTVVALSQLIDAGTLTNDGSLVVDPPVTVTGTFINSSIVSAPGTSAAFDLANSGVLSNASTGTITAYGAAVTASGTGTASVVNLGTIQAGLGTTNSTGIILTAGTIVNGASGDTTALISGISAADIQTGLIDNYATITGRFFGVGVGGAGQLTNQAAGVITAPDYAIVLSGAGARATNLGTVSGTFVGALAYNTGELLTNGAGAQIAGTSIAGVVLFAYKTGLSIETVVNYGTITGKAGVEFAENVTSATLQATLIDAGTIIGTGGTAVANYPHGGAAASLLLQFRPGNAFIQGTVVGENSGTGVLEFASGASAGTLTGSSADFTNFQTASVDAGANWTLAGDVTLGSGVTLNNAGTLGNAGTLTLLGAVDDSGTLTNTGSIDVANYGGLQLAAGGYLRNDSAGLITRGTIGAASFNAAVIGLSGGPSTIVNDGTIQNSHGDLAVYLRGGGVIINGATNGTAALISGTVGVYVHGLATISNFGTVSGATGIEAYGGGTITNGASNSTAALVSGGRYGVVLDHAGTFTNYGMVSAGTEYAVRLRYGAVVTNAGLLTGAAGIVAQIGTAQITNTGTIIGTGGDGIQLAGAGTVIDSGAIIGSSTAIAFNGTGSNLLVLEHGYTLSGSVFGAASASNTLELLGTSAADAVTANYDGLGLTNFATIAFAPTATNYATLKITNDAVLPRTITGFTGLSDTIDLTGLAFVTGTSSAAFNSASDQVTISNGASSVVLQLGSGSYAGAFWAVVNDGSGGTDVLPVLGGAPSITSSADYVGVPNQGVATPFQELTVTDANSAAHPDTVTVTMSNPSGGAFSTTVAGGSYDAVAGTYTFTGTASEVTAALQALQFTPSAPGNGASVATTHFTVQVSGIGGSASNDLISVTTVTQPSALTGKPDAISVSPDGSSFGPTVAGANNEAVISSPVNGGRYSLPGGYQAGFLGGSADATLTDGTVGNALLVGNRGNDTLSAGASNDTLVGGAGNNLFTASGTQDVIGTTGISTVQTSGTDDTVYAGSGAVTLTDTGHGDALGLSSGPANVSLAGGNASLYGNSGNVTLVDTGSNDAIGGGSGAVTATLAGSGTRVYGGSGPLTLNVASTASGIAIGAGSTTNSVTIAGSSTTLYGSSGSLSADVTGPNARIGLDSGSAAITLSGSRAEIFGGSGPLAVDDLGRNDTIAGAGGSTTVTAGGGSAVVVGGSGAMQLIGGAGDATVYASSGSVSVTGGAGAMTLYGGAGGLLQYRGGSGPVIYQAGPGAETLNAAGSSANMVVNGGIDPTGHDLLIAGSGNDSLFAGSGADTFTGGSGNNEFVFYKTVINGSAPHEVITDFGSNDAVYLAGYGAGAASAALDRAASSGGSTTITLSDNTQITFLNIASGSSLVGHVVSF